MRVMITGANGHVGGEILKYLQICGHEVVAVSLPSQNIKNTEFVEADIGEISFVGNIKKLVKKCDAIVHAAADTNKDFFERSVINTNCIGTYNLILLANSWKVKRFVYISGNTVIGNPLQAPMTENDATSPESLYTASKLFGEHITQLANKNRISSISLRLTSPIGPNTKSGILRSFLSNAQSDKQITVFGKGTRIQNYVDIRDVISVVEKCLHCDNSGVFNISGPYGISNIGLAELCVELCKSKSKIIFSGTDIEDGISYETSFDKAQKYLSYIPRYTIKDSILNMLD